MGEFYSLQVFVSRGVSTFFYKKSKSSLSEEINSFFFFLLEKCCTEQQNSGLDGKSKQFYSLLQNTLIEDCTSSIQLSNPLECGAS